MRVLITGAGGQVGHELLRQTPAGIEAIGLTSAELDISNGVQVAETCARLQPALIINAAAYTAVDKAESEPERAHAVNAEGVAHLTQAAAAAGIPLLHISTDYVFLGDAGAPYREEDASGPIRRVRREQAGWRAGCGPVPPAYRAAHQLGIRQHFAKTMLRVTAQNEVLGGLSSRSGRSLPPASRRRCGRSPANGNPGASCPEASTTTAAHRPAAGMGLPRNLPPSSRTGPADESAAGQRHHHRRLPNPGALSGLVGARLHEDPARWVS